MESDETRFGELWNAAERVVVITGAGVSAESGVPTFRGSDGLWNNFRAEKLATPEAFAHDPQLVWQWYRWRRDRIREARPNSAHLWLATQERVKNEFLLITQNVDGLHRLAGSERLVEIHGNLWIDRCTLCGAERENRLKGEGIAKCVRCDGDARPGVVWFGESLPKEGLRRAIEAVERCDLILMLGTSAIVYPVAGLPSLCPNAVKLEVNPEPTPFTPYSVLSVRARAGSFLSSLSSG